MQILKAFFRIAGKLKGTLIMYIGIFVGIGMMVSMDSSSDTSKLFKDSSLDVVVYDDDGTAESKALYDYIGSKHKIVEMKRDDTLLCDNLYNRWITGVVYIDKGYAEKLAKGETEGIISYSVDPASYDSEYLTMQLEQYISTLSTYLSCGEDITAAQADTIAALENTTDVTVQNFSDKSESSDTNGFIVFMRYIAYILPAIMITVLSRIIIELRGENIRNRIFCSPITSMKFTGQIILGSVIFSLAIWLLEAVIAYILGGTPALTEEILLAFASSFIYMLAATGIGIFISMCFGSNSLAIDMIANIVCLGMAFLCGVFVPQSVMGDSVLRVGRFLPAYWYVKAIDSIGQVDGAVYDQTMVLQNMGVVALFAAAFFALSMVASKFRKS